MYKTYIEDYNLDITRYNKYVVDNGLTFKIFCLPFVIREKVGFYYIYKFDITDKKIDINEVRKFIKSNEFVVSIDGDFLIVSYDSVKTAFEDEDIIDSLKVVKKISDFIKTK